MAVFFNGRLWISPVTASVVDDSQMFNRNLSVANILALVGTSVGGQPFTALRFGSPSEARSALIAGDLLTAVEKAFDASAQTGAPSEIVCVRVNPATQSTLNLKDSGNNTLVGLASTDYGLYTNQIKVKIESASLTGYKITSQFGNNYCVKDNIYRNAFSVQYTGAQATATMTVSGGSVVLAAPAGTTVATIDLTVYSTVQQVVDAINAVAGFGASVLDGNQDTPALQGLDFCSAQSVLTLYTVTANLQAAVDWFNGQGEGYVTATRLPNVGAALANINWTYLAGGTDGVTTNLTWQQGFDTLQTEDVQWVVPVSSSSSVQAMADTHVSYMSNVARMERRCIVGTAIGTTDDQAIAAAKTFNNDRTSLVHLGYYDYDDATGNLVLRPPFILAGLLGGMFSGVDPGTALTNKSIKVRGLERNLRNPVDTDRLIQGGVLCVENTKQGYKVVKSISTWLVNQNYNRVEVSTGVACDFVSRNVRNALDTLRGARGNPATLMLAVEITESTLRELARPEPAGPGVIVGDAVNPPYKNITASIEGDVLRVEFQCSPVIPINYVTVVIHAVPWSGTITQ